MQRVCVCARLDICAVVCVAGTLRIENEPRISRSFIFVARLHCIFVLFTFQYARCAHFLRRFSSSRQPQMKPLCSFQIYLFFLLTVIICVAEIHLRNANVFIAIDKTNAMSFIQQCRENDNCFLRQRSLSLFIRCVCGVCFFSRAAKICNVICVWHRNANVLRVCRVLKALNFNLLEKSTVFACIGRDYLCTHCAQRICPHGPVTMKTACIFVVRQCDARATRFVACQLLFEKCLPSMPYTVAHCTKPEQSNGMAYHIISAGIIIKTMRSEQPSFSANQTKNCAVWSRPKYHSAPFYSKRK